MSFILMQLSPGFMRWKGQKAFTGIASVTASVELAVYQGVKTGILLEVLTNTGKVFPLDEFKSAYALSKATPVLLTEPIFDIADPLTEIFVLPNNSRHLIEEVAIGRFLPDSLNGINLPVNFYQADIFLGQGWVKQLSDMLEIRLLTDNTQSLSGDIVIRLVHSTEINFRLSL